ncbi:MAG: aminotransferase class V-fold PLP-dependent enzyme [Gammaproteobacteria bacterium]|nr:aminotransferase class V-fold PLP-dependent enzyme [Gammaproteobacteria bacterium]
MIYLDYAASTPLDPRVLDAMLPFLREQHANPASDHAPGRQARAAVERARAQVAALVGAEPAEIVWTSGATESDNLAIKGALEFYKSRGRHVVTARTEHKAVLDACRHLETQGARVTYLKPQPDGRVAPEQVLAALEPDTVLVSLMWVNNETGVVNGIERLAPLLRERGVLFHVDAAQAAGRVPIDLAATPVDLLSLSAHKVCGPKGIGALFVRRRPRARLAPQMHGGGHEQGMRSGTLATHQIVGMGRAFELAAQELAADAARVAGLRDGLCKRLLRLPGTILNGADAPRVPHIVNLSFAGVEGEALRASLPDLALSSGSACSSATQEPSYVLRALGRDDGLANASLRFSCGRFTTEAEVAAAAERVVRQVLRLRAIAGETSPSPLAGEGEGGGAGATAPPPPGPLPRGEGEFPPDVYGYGERVWQRFWQPAESLLPESAPGVFTAQAGTPAGRQRLRLQLQIVDGRVAAARFAAYGCPTTLAVGAWLARRAEGRALAELRAVNAAEIRQALEIPEARAHCSLLGEDALNAVLSAAANRHVAATY